MIVATHQGRGDRVEQLLVIASGQIGATDRPVEQHITREADRHALPRLGIVGQIRSQQNAAGRMPRRVGHAPSNSRDLDVLAVDELDHLLGLPEHGVPDHLRESASHTDTRIGQHGTVGSVDVCGNGELIGQLLSIPGVVEMPVRQEDRDGSQRVLGQRLADVRRGILAGIDDDRVRPGPLGHQIAVGLEHSGGESGDQHLVSLSSSM